LTDAAGVKREGKWVHGEFSHWVDNI